MLRCIRIISIMLIHLGSSPPTYDEAIHDHQFDIGGPSSEQTASSQIDKEPEKPHSHGPMEPLARGSTAPSAPPLSEIADQVDEPEAPQHPTPTTRSEGLFSYEC